MPDKQRLKVVICWHMHQPQYYNIGTQQYELPWTYLHAIKDYVDMANILAANPNARAVINFAPILLEQLDDYSQQIDSFLTQQTPISDPLLNALANIEISPSLEQRNQMVQACLKANEARLIKRFPNYEKLVTIAKQLNNIEQALTYCNEQYFSDLLVWYHLAWLGETVRREDPFIQALIKKGALYTAEDRQLLLRLIGKLLSSIIPAYKKLRENRQIELAFSPYAHPIVPLLLDVKSAQEAMPEVTLPNCLNYPEGKARALWHFAEGKKVFEHYFGFEPNACWPSEGAISEDTLKLCNEMGIHWVASGESVMRNSLEQSKTQAEFLENGCLHRSYVYQEANKVQCFFRDDGLSDLIGFTYSNWDADDAVNNLIHHLENICKACSTNSDAVVPIILDGENAWEHYHENGFHFLTTLYDKLAKHPEIELTTFAQAISNDITPIVLDKLVAGSWVYGSFSTWIGDKDKNKGWDLLCEAKKAFDDTINSGNLDEKEMLNACKQLAICEGSDWFWWLGDYNSADSVSDFENLYRLHLIELYRLLKKPTPENLKQVLSYGEGDPEGGGSMRHGQQQHTRSN